MDRVTVMAKLKLGPIADEKPVRLAVELPAAVHRDLLVYAEVLAGETGQAVDGARVIAPMLARFMATDRGFAKARRAVRYAASASQIPTTLLADSPTQNESGNPGNI